MPSKDVYTFVLVHGAWHGGWCWGLVAQILRARGHNVSAPTLTGLGERAHLLTEHVDFETFVLDVQSHIETERLRDVVLVGHSFGGNVITVVADKSVNRIKRLIFLDAALPEDGRNIMDQLSHTVAEGLLQSAVTKQGIPVPSHTLSVGDLGLFTYQKSSTSEALRTPIRYWSSCEAPS